MEEDLAREAAALKAAGRAIDPYIEELAELRKEVRSLTRLVNDLRDDAARINKYADDDRKRLAETVKEGAEEQATEIATHIVSQALKSLAIDADKSGDFVKDMIFLRELRETFGVMRRHAITVLIGIIMLGITTGVWQALKAGAKP